ncbi:MAG: hypothetical protein KL785_04300 [Brevundimonas sp.]|nr:hypothetical protein [Brevundimonas sp.]
MKRFSIGASIGDGFGLIARRPLAVFVWGLLLLAPTFASFGLMLPMMGEMFANMPQSGSDYPADSAFPDRLMAEMMQFQLVSMLLNIVQLLAMAVVYTAIFRAVLKPRGAQRLLPPRRHGRVARGGRRSGDRRRPVRGDDRPSCSSPPPWDSRCGAAIRRSRSAPSSPSPSCFFCSSCGGVSRVSMMAPASVLYRDFAFAQGWRLASGQSWPLFGMMVLIFLMILAIEVALVLAGVFAFSGLWASFGPAWAGTEANPFAEMDAWLAANWYWAVIGGAVTALIYGCVPDARRRPVRLGLPAAGGEQRAVFG